MVDNIVSRKKVPTPFGDKYINNPIYRTCCIAEVINLLTQKTIKSKNFDFVSFTQHINFSKNWLIPGTELIVTYDTAKFSNKLQPIIYDVSTLKCGYLSNDKYILNQIDHCFGFVGGLKNNRFLFDIDFESHIKNMTQQADTCEVIIPAITYKKNIIKSIQVPLYTDELVFPNKQAIKTFQKNFDLLLCLLEDYPEIKIIDPNIIELP